MHSTKKYFLKNKFLSGRQNNLIYWQNEQKVLPPIAKSIRLLQCCAMDELSYLLACNLYQNEEEGQALYFYAEISGENYHNFLQSTIINQQKSCYLMSQSKPGTLCLKTRSAPGTRYLSAVVLEELTLLYLGSLSALGFQI